MTEWFWKRLNQFSGWIATLAFFGLVIFLANIEIKDPDLWLHLASGRYIFANFTIPKVDFLSCAVSGAPWINHEWLFQVIVHMMYGWAGPEGLITLRVVVVGITFALLFLLGVHSNSKQRHVVPLLSLLLVLLVYQFRLTLRPDVFSLLFFTLYISILSSALFSEESNSRRLWVSSSVWGLFVIQVLWTNMHGFFILGPGLVGIVIIGEWIKRHVKLPYQWNAIGRLSDAEYKRLKQVLGIVFLACLCNPYFLEGLWYPFRVMFSLSGDSKMFFAHIKELQRPLTWHTFFALSDTNYLSFRLLIFISAGSFVWNRRKVDIGVFLWWSVFLFLALNAVRNIVFFSFAAYFVILSNFQELSIGDILPKKFRQQGSYLGAIVVKVLFVFWIATFIKGQSLRGYFDFDKYTRKSEYAGISQRNFPYKAVDFLVKNNIKGDFFNDFNSGAYLLGRAFPNIKVVIDGRTEVYGADFFKNHQKAWKGDTAIFDEMVERHQLTGAFLNAVYVAAPPGLIHYLYTSESWVLVYFDYDATIFLRDIPANASWIKEYKIDLAQWQSPEMVLRKIGLRKVTPYQHINRAQALYNMKFFDKALQQAKEALAIQSYNADAHKIIGKIYIQNKEYAKAFEYLRQAKILNPRDIETRYHLGICYYHFGEIEEAQKQCEKVLARNKKSSKGLLLLSLIRVEQGKYQQALKLLHKAYQNEPKQNINKFLEIADFFYERKEWTQAQEVYNIVLEIESENIQANEKLKVLGLQNF